jgi:hypothetical protein
LLLGAHHYLAYGYPCGLLEREDHSTGHVVRRERLYFIEQRPDLRVVMGEGRVY